MKVQCAISFGLIQMIDADGAYHQEEQDIRSDRIFQRLSIITTA
jgi:hypothetical protein